MSSSSPTAQFGPNEWLVDEMYQRYLADPSSVDPAWHEFFADYRPADSQLDGADDQQTADADHATPTRPAAAPAAVRTRTRQGAHEHRVALPGRAPLAANGSAPAGSTTGTGSPSAPSTDGARTTSSRSGETAEQAPGRHHEPRQGRPARRGRRRRPDDEAVARRRERRSSKNMTASLSAADRDQRARGAGEAAGRQPHRHQQPPASAPAAARSRFTHLHRLRGGPGARRLPEHEPALRRGRRQAGRRRRRSTSTSAWRSTCRARTASRTLVVVVDQGLREHDLRAVLAGLRGHGPQGPQRHADRARTSPAPRSA